VRGLNKSYGDKHVVQDLTIQVGSGKITGFLGPNGSGKTTTLRMLCGLLTPDAARARCWAWTSGAMPRRSSARPAT
jgi:ABC-type multidrug transport system ATPase subunit